MNGKRRMIAVSAIGMLVLLVTTGWGVLAGDAWPPQAYQAYVESIRTGATLPLRGMDRLTFQEARKLPGR